MSRLEDLNTLVRLLKEFDLPVSPILEYAIKEKDEELRQCSSSSDQSDGLVHNSSAITFDRASNADPYEDRTIARVETEQYSSKSRTEILRVEYPDGRVVSHPRASQTYIEVISDCSPEKIHELRIIHAGVNIVSKEYDTLYAKAQHRIKDGWLVFTNTPTRKKYDDLVRISNELGLDLKVDIIAKATHDVIEVDSIPNNSSRQKIKVSFPNGRTIQPNRVYEALIEVVRFAGAERVRQLNIVVCGNNLVLPKPLQRYEQACKRVDSEWYVNTCSDTSRKYEQILQISDKLNLGLSIELIGGDGGSLSEIEINNGVLRIKDYSDKAIVIYGDTNGHEPFLLNQFGSFNHYLPEGPGWLFSKKREQNIVDYFKSKSIPIVVQNGFLQTFLDQLSQMKAMIRKGIKSPHKAIYLMAIMHGIRDGRLNYNKICLDHYLIQTFNHYWSNYVPSDFPYIMDIANPYMFLSNEPFYFINTIAEIPNFKRGWSIPAIKEVCDYAYISNELYQLINDDNCYEVIMKHLIGMYDLKKH